MRVRGRRALLIHLMAVLVAVQGVIGLVPGAEACLAIATCAHEACETGCRDGAGCHDGESCHDGAGTAGLHRHGDGVLHRHESPCGRRARVGDEGGRCGHPPADSVAERAASAGAIEPVRDACACHLHLGVSDADALPAPVRGILATIETVTQSFACMLSAIVACDPSEAAPRPPLDVRDGPPACERSIVATTVLLL